jgi:hypothetical protein
MRLRGYVGAQLGYEGQHSVLYVAATVAGPATGSDNTSAPPPPPHAPTPPPPLTPPPAAP